MLRAGSDTEELLIVDFLLLIESVEISENPWAFFFVLSMPRCLRGEFSFSNVQFHSDFVTSTGSSFRPWRWASFTIVAGE